MIKLTNEVEFVFFSIFLSIAYVSLFSQLSFKLSFFREEFIKRKIIQMAIFDRVVAAFVVVLFNMTYIYTLFTKINEKQLLTLPLVVGIVTLSFSMILGAHFCSRILIANYTKLNLLYNEVFSKDEIDSKGTIVFVKTYCGFVFINNVTCLILIFAWIVQSFLNYL